MLYMVGNDRDGIWFFIEVLITTLVGGQGSAQK